MTKIRKIARKPVVKQYYLVDANFLVNKFIPHARVTNHYEYSRVVRSQDWWVEIDDQVRNKLAKVYIPDICIAESFKVLAKKYYVDKYFRNSREYKFSRDLLRDYVRISDTTLKTANRRINVHDISISRDIIISVDRFYESFLKRKIIVSLVDLIILSTAKYLEDFYDIPLASLHIITLDNSIWRGTRNIKDIPTAFNPNNINEIASKVFV
jgi:hypothetical protein